MARLLDFIKKHQGPWVESDYHTIIDFLTRGANPDEPDRFGMTALMHVKKIDVDVARLLIGAGAKVNHVNRMGKTPLHYAAQEAQAELADFYIQCGAEVNSAHLKTGNQTPIYFTLRTDALNPVLKLLIEKGANLSHKDNDGATPLHTAAYHDNEGIPILLDHGADKDATTNDGLRPADMTEKWKTVLS